MTQQEFNALDHNSKILLLTEMPHVGERFEPEYTVLLFQMDGWLLEAYHHRRAGAMHFEAIMHNRQLEDFILSEKGIALPNGSISTASPGLLAYNYRRLALKTKRYFSGIQQFFAVLGIGHAPTHRKIA